MMNPVRNLGATLMQYYAWGSIWCIGYFVKPMLLARFAEQADFNEIEKVITELTQLNLLLACVCLIIYVVSRLHQSQWQIKKQVGSQLTLAAIFLIIFYFIANQSNKDMLPIIYAIISMLGIAQVSFSMQSKNESNNEQPQ